MALRNTLVGALAALLGTAMSASASPRVSEIEFSPSGSRIIRTLPLPDAAPRRAVLREPSSKECYRLPRATEDRRTGEPRDVRLVHVVYLLASDLPDEGLDTNGTLDCSMRAQNQWMAEQTELVWRLDTFPAKVRVPGAKRKVKVDAVDVTFIRSKHTADELNNAGIVSEELQEHDLAQPDKRYLTFVAGGGESSPCGDAYWPFDSQDPNSDGQYAQIYMFSAEGCHAHEFGVPGNPSFVEAIAQQEIMHNDGMVPLGAPHGCGPLGLPAHVCTGPLWATEGFADLDPERVDILFPFVNVPLSGKFVDRDRDDYFGHPFPYRDLDQSPYLIPAKN